MQAICEGGWEHLAHADLPHQLVLVAVHAGELPHVCKGVLQPVRQLEGIHIAQPELHIGVHYQLGQPQDLSAIDAFSMNLHLK